MRRGIFHRKGTIFHMMDYYISRAGLKYFTGRIIIFHGKDYYYMTTQLCRAVPEDINR